MTGFIDPSLYHLSHNYNQYSAIADLHIFQFTVAHALTFSVFTSRILATDLNTETITSNHYEVFLPFLVQSFLNADPPELDQIIHFSSFLTLYSSVLQIDAARTTYKTLLLLRGADHIENTSTVARTVVLPSNEL
jgi:hypothetical protein